MLNWAADYKNINLEFNTLENGIKVKAVFVPEKDITTNEITLIFMLFLAFNYSTPYEAPMTFIRNHSLERHFKFSS
jgi:hypothetical protein